ncbi:MAG: hypothetical protein LBD03_05070 [Methanobrevibacter sp.]|jgi:predicted transcriptional regulator|nr:hypothetical protein [Candidatus Methanovirga procula]
MLKKVFGKCPQVKVLDFLLSSSNKYFNKSQISKLSEISRPTLDNFINDFLEFGLLKKSNQGYELNISSELVKYFIKANLLLANTEIDLQKDSFIQENYSDEELDDLLKDIFEDDIDYNERIENNEEILVNKQEYKDLKDFYIKNYDLVKYLMDNQSSNMLNFKNIYCKTCFC